MNTEFYNQMISLKRDNQWSTREMAAKCGLCHGTLIEFFDKDKIFRPLRDSTMGKIHQAFGISYEVMDQYNEIIKKGE